jgi:hypothetical protein
LIDGFSNPRFKGQVGLVETPNLEEFFVRQKYSEKWAFTCSIEKHGFSCAQVPD